MCGKVAVSLRHIFVAHVKMSAQLTLNHNLITDGVFQVFPYASDGTTLGVCLREERVYISRVVVHEDIGQRADLMKLLKC